jgi:hypothetical protein
MEVVKDKEIKSKNSLRNFNDLIVNTGRIFGILFKNMPWLFSSMVALSIIIGVIPIFSAQLWGDL